MVGDAVSTGSVTAEQILDFWFSEPARQRWFNATPAFDAEIRQRLEPTWREASDGRLDHWSDTPGGALALVIVLDQLPLHMYRNQRQAYQTEAKARAISLRAIDEGWDSLLPDEQKGFLYLPLMHSEALADQERSVALYEKAGLADGLRWARHHRDLIRRFGRFPHRNAALGRQNTPQERAYLASADAYRG